MKKALFYLLALALVGCHAAPAVQDGLTPETAVKAGPGTFKSSGRSSYQAKPVTGRIIWLVTGRQCYLEIQLDQFVFVTVPEDWCAGMR